MKRRGLVAIIALAMSFPVGAAEQKSEQSLGSQQQTYTPSLAVEMGLIQVSHFKLWLAGNVRNWPLAEYQLSQMKKTLHDCRTSFRMWLLQTRAPYRGPQTSFSMRSGPWMAANSTQPLNGLRQSATIATKGPVWNLSE